MSTGGVFGEGDSCQDEKERYVLKDHCQHDKPTECQKPCYESKIQLFGDIYGQVTQTYRIDQPKTMLILIRLSKEQ